MALVAFKVVPVAVAFFGAAVILLRPLALAARGFDVIEWPILIMLGALIPLSNTLCTTGGTDLIASALSYDAISSLRSGINATRG